VVDHVTLRHEARCRSWWHTLVQSFMRCCRRPKREFLFQARSHLRDIKKVSRTRERARPKRAQSGCFGCVCVFSPPRARAGRGGRDELTEGPLLATTLLSLPALCFAFFFALVLFDIPSRVSHDTSAPSAHIRALKCLGSALYSNILSAVTSGHFAAFFVPCVSSHVFSLASSVLQPACPSDFLCVLCSWLPATECDWCSVPQLCQSWSR